MSSDQTSPMAALMHAITDRRARVGVIGLGYVGLPLAVTAAQAGFTVTGFDVDATKMTQLDAGTSYIDAVRDEDLAAVADRFDWSTEFARLAEADVIVICVPTPLTRQREPDLSYVEATARTIATHLSAGTLVALESTTWPGTTREVLIPLLEASGLKSGTDIFVGFSPEREDPGNATYRTATIPKIVAGEGAQAGNLMEAFYSAVVEQAVRVPDTATAEAVKITENVFRAVNIALVNELTTSGMWWRGLRPSLLGICPFIPVPVWAGTVSRSIRSTSPGARGPLMCRPVLSSWPERSTLRCRAMCWTGCARPLMRRQGGA